MDSWLEGPGITNPFLNRVIGQVADVTIKSMMAVRRRETVEQHHDSGSRRRAGRPGVKYGHPGLLVDPELQVALGLSPGDGIGSLFGDNIFGYMIGVATGGAAAITISVGRRHHPDLRRAVPGGAGVQATITAHPGSPSPGATSTRTLGPIRRAPWFRAVVVGKHCVEDSPRTLAGFHRLLGADAHRQPGFS